MKKIVSFVLTVLVVLGCMVTTPVAGALSTDQNSFKSGNLIKCGKYYFAVCDNSLVRVNKKGQKAKEMDTDVANQLYSKGKALYYQKRVTGETEAPIMKLNSANSKKSTVLKVTSDEALVGIYKKGLVTRASEYIYIRNFKGKVVKKISAGFNGSLYKTYYMGSNDKYIFFSKTEEKRNTYNSDYKCSLLRYDVKTKKVQNKGVFVTQEDKQYTPSCIDFHAYKKCIVFTFGTYEGSGTFYYGDSFKMSASGTGIRKLSSDVMEKIIPGKGCVYIEGNSNVNGKEAKGLKITKKGKVSKISNSKIRYTLGKYAIYDKKTDRDSEYDLMRCLASGKKSKKLISAKSLIKSTDPSDAFSNFTIVSSSGNLALVRYSVNSYRSHIGYRPEVLRNLYYIVNVKTGKSTLVKTHEY